MQITEPDSASKHVPEAERERRLTSLRASLTGLCIGGPLEPGRKLLDETCHQEATSQLKYLPPDKCISRLHEVTHAKESSRQIELEHTRVIIRDAQESPNMHASSALQVLEALRRRGLAYVFAQSVTWTEYDRYLTKLFAHMSRDPPPGFNRQIVEAERQVSVRMIEANVKPCKTASGTMPMDDALMRALESYEVSFVLMHAPSSAVPATNPSQDFCIVELKMLTFIRLSGWLSYADLDMNGRLGFGVSIASMCRLCMPALASFTKRQPCIVILSPSVVRIWAPATPGLQDTTFQRNCARAGAQRS